MKKKLKIPDEKFLIEFTINLTQYGIPIFAIIFVAIYFFCGIFYAYLDPKYNF